MCLVSINLKGCKLNCIQCVLNWVMLTVWSKPTQYTVYSVHRKVHSVEGKVYSVQCSAVDASAAVCDSRRIFLHLVLGTPQWGLSAHQRDTAHCTAHYIDNCTVYTLHCTLHTTLNSVQCILYNVHCKLH